jgi:hypothetical protein
MLGSRIRKIKVASMSGGDRLQAFLDKMPKDGEPYVKVGFLADATYPDGTNVAAVAAMNEFGVPSHKQPPRPFFRTMISQKSPGWGRAVADLMRANDMKVAKVLDLEGQGIKGQLQQSIVDLVDPPLAPSTVKAKGFATPLIDTGHMLASVDYEVVE